MAKKQESLQTIALNFLETRSHSSFKILADRLRPGLFTFLYKILKDTDQTNDALTQTYAALWNKVDQYNKMFNFSTWAYAIARNEAYGILREKAKTISIENMSVAATNRMYMYSGVIANTNMEVIGPVGEDLIKNMHSKAVSIMDELEEPYKTVIIERELKNKQLQEIADKLNWNLNTVKTRLRKARKEVATILKQRHPSLTELYLENEHANDQNY